MLDNLPKYDEINRRILRILLMGFITYSYLNNINLLSAQQNLNLIIVILIVFMILDIYIPQVLIIK